jgi:type IV pilus assembly protein PilW
MRSLNLPTTARRPQDGGFTIIEMMIALTVSLFIVAALFMVVSGGLAASTTRERASELQTNGRYAVEQIKKDLMHAGFLGLSSLFTPDVALTAGDPGPPAIPAIVVANACDAANVGRLSQRLWGAHENNPFAATCIPAANYLRGDVLVIRGVDPAPVTAPFSNTVVYYHSAYEGGAPFVGPTPPDFTPPLTNRHPPYIDYRVSETVYYVSPYTNSPTESPMVPALYRLRLVDGPAMAPELVASGVEQFQVRYGVFQTNDTVRYLRADEMATAEWDLVRAVQVFVLMRTATPESGYANNTSFAMGGVNYAVNDGYPRLLLASTVQQRN